MTGKIDLRTRPHVFSAPLLLCAMNQLNVAPFRANPVVSSLPNRDLPQRSNPRSRALRRNYADVRPHGGFAVGALNPESEFNKHLPSCLNKQHSGGPAATPRMVNRHRLKRANSSAKRSVTSARANTARVPRSRRSPLVFRKRAGRGCRSLRPAATAKWQRKRAMTSRPEPLANARRANALAPPRQL